jgi:hypothetical protein
MNEQLVLEVQQPAAIAQPMTPMGLIQQALVAAIQQGGALEVVDRILAQQKAMVEYQAECEFNEALQRVQGQIKHIRADLENPQTRSRYASYAKLDSAIRPIADREGFSLSFNTLPGAAPDTVRVACYVSRGGHTRTYSLDMPADGKGAKGGDVMTKTHATGAAMSYGMRYLLKMIFNVAVGEDDTDGNGPRQERKMNEKDYLDYLDAIRNCNTLDELKRFSTAAQKTALELADQAAMKDFIAARDAKKEALR